MDDAWQRHVERGCMADTSSFRMLLITHCHQPAVLQVLLQLLSSVPGARSSLKQVPKLALLSSEQGRLLQAPFSPWSPFWTLLCPLRKDMVPMAPSVAPSIPGLL